MHNNTEDFSVNHLSTAAEKITLYSFAEEPISLSAENTYRCMVSELFTLIPFSPDGLGINGVFIYRAQ